MPRTRADGPLRRHRTRFTNIRARRVDRIWERRRRGWRRRRLRRGWRRRRRSRRRWLHGWLSVACSAGDGACCTHVRRILPALVVPSPHLALCHAVLARAIARAGRRRHGRHAHLCRCTQSAAARRRRGHWYGLCWRLLLIFECPCRCCLGGFGAVCALRVEGWAVWVAQLARLELVRQLRVPRAIGVASHIMLP